MNSQSRMMMDALRNTMVAASDQPSSYAEGGVVSALPTLQDLSNPNFDYSSMGKLNTDFTATPFASMTQDAPITAIQGPAYGSMGADVYDWKAPTAQAAPQPYSTANMEAAQVYNRRVPTAAATVNVPMPGVATPPPNVPTPDYMPTMPGMEGGPTMDPNYLAPQAPVTQAPVTSSPAFTSVTNPLGPTPEEVRRTQAAADLEAFNQRQAAQAAQMAEAKRIADEAAARRAQEATAAAAEAERKAQYQRAADKLFSDTQQIEANRVRQEQERAQAPAAAEGPKPWDPSEIEKIDFSMTPNLWQNANLANWHISRGDPGGYAQQFIDVVRAAQANPNYSENNSNSWYAGDSGEGSSSGSPGEGNDEGATGQGAGTGAEGPGTE